MTGNKFYLTDYEDYDGRFVSFRDGKGRIFGKGKIKTGTLDFDDVYFCKELEYNMFRIKREFSVAKTPQQNEQYFLMIDYSLWEVIKNGNKVLTKTVGTVEQIYEPTVVEEKLDKKNEMKARGTLLMALPNKDQLKLQKLISQLEIQGEVIEQEDINLKMLRSLSSKWNTCALIWRNKVEIETINNLSDVVIYYFLASQPNSPQLAREDLEQINPDDLEEMDLHWEIAMLTIRARRFIKRKGRNLDINGQKSGFDRSKMKCFNCHKHGHFARECRALKNQENRGRECGRKTVPLENPIENSLIAQRGIRWYDLSYQAEEKHQTNIALMALTSSGSSSSLDSE
nr:hypothetical protein [Tanacetum cinerariifolium]